MARIAVQWFITFSTMVHPLFGLTHFVVHPFCGSSLLWFIPFVFHPFCGSSLLWFIPFVVHPFLWLIPLCRRGEIVWLECRQESCMMFWGHPNHPHSFSSACHLCSLLHAFCGGSRSRIRKQRRKRNCRNDFSRGVASICVYIAKQNFYGL